MIVGKGMRRGLCVYKQTRGLDHVFVKRYLLTRGVTTSIQGILYCYNYAMQQPPIYSPKIDYIKYQYKSIGCIDQQKKFPYQPSINQPINSFTFSRFPLQPPSLALVSIHSSLRLIQNGPQAFNLRYHGCKDCHAPTRSSKAESPKLQSESFGAEPVSRPNDRRSGCVRASSTLMLCHIESPFVTDANIGCWASNGQVSAVCLNLEQQLRTCMDSKVWISFIYGLGFGSDISAGAAESCQELDQQEPHSLL
jgi:hypothetical protein